MVWFLFTLSLFFSSLYPFHFKNFSRFICTFSLYSFFYILSLVFVSLNLKKKNRPYRQSACSFLKWNQPLWSTHYFVFCIYVHHFRCICISLFHSFSLFLVLSLFFSLSHSLYLPRSQFIVVYLTLTDQSFFFSLFLSFSVSSISISPYFSGCYFTFFLTFS